MSGKFNCIQKNRYAFIWKYTAERWQVAALVWAMFLVQNRQQSFCSTHTYFHLSTNVACNPVSSSNTWWHPKIGPSLGADTVESCQMVVEIVAWVLILIWLISPIIAVQIMKIVETRLTTVHKINNIRMVTTNIANKPQGENVNIPEDWLHVLYKGHIRDICFASCQFWCITCWLSEWVGIAAIQIR